MAQSDQPKMFPRRFITMSMADKYMAVCFIYDGIQYQNLCKEENPDGTSNYSEKCLNSLSYNLPFIGSDSNTSLSTDSALVPYTRQDQNEFPDILSAISHYWFEVALLCLISALTFHIAFITLRRRSSLFTSWFQTYSNERSQKVTRYSAGPTVDEQGVISIGKISFDPKSVLGFGSKGTCVFKGDFEGSLNCAVKRIVSQYLSIADREVEFLRSLQDPNLVRYLATEQDAQFIYIALELAEFTLGELVETNRISTIGLSKEELCRQSAMGLAYLHKLDIVHRDIKPHNILISFPMKPSNDRKVMISDFGLSKQLGNMDTGHTSSAMRCFDGTQGWMAPEIVNAKMNEDKSLMPTKSADIFSLGCVFYYIISSGKHPFGQLDQRQTNILNDDSVLSTFNLLDDDGSDLPEEVVVMAFKLIQSMIQHQPENRPPINSILKYPLFWSKADQLQFLQDVSDRIDKEENNSDIVGQVERQRKKIFAFGWKDCLSQELQDDLGSFRTYNHRSVRHLLRAIRNKRHHYRELPECLKESLGEVPDGYMTYFSSRFPELLPHIYQAMQPCKNEGIFRAYYEQLDDYCFR